MSPERGVVAVCGEARTIQSVDLGHLSDLIDRLSGMGVGLTITPLLEDGRSFDSDEIVFVAGWQITYQTVHGTFTATGKTLAAAVDAAFAYPGAW
jgi:hypothetical protein